MRERADDGLGLRSLVSKASQLSAVSILAAALSIPATLIAAAWLGPGDFGRVQTVLVVYFYASLIRSGVFEGAMRTYIHRTAAGEIDAARRARDVGVTFEAIVSLVPGILVFAWAFTSDEPLMRMGLALAPVAVMAASTTAFLGGIALASERFGLAARAGATRAIAFPVVLLAGVPTMGPAAVFIAPIVADLASSAVYGKHLSSERLRPNWDRLEAVALLRIGFPLGMGAITYWAYRQVGSGFIAALRPPSALGIYAFAAAPVSVMMRLLSALPSVMSPALWSSMAVASDRQWVRQSTRIAVFVAVVAGFATNASQAVFGPAVSILAEDFLPAVEVFNILAINVQLLTIALVPSLVLNAATVNRQSRHLVIWIAGLAANSMANLVVLSRGLGVTAVAWNDIWVQAVIALAIHAAAADVLVAEEGWRRCRAELLALVALTFAATAVMAALPTDPGSGTSAVALAAGRLAAVAGVWTAAGWFLLRRGRA